LDNTPNNYHEKLDHWCTFQNTLEKQYYLTIPNLLNKY